MDRVALDIETISTVPDPDFDAPEHWVPFCIATGHVSPSSPSPDVEVHFREDSTLESEAQLLHDVVDWVADRCDSGDRILVTYNGNSYDIPILKHRGRAIDGEIPGVNVTQRLYFLVKTSQHADLMEDMVERKGYHVSLDDCLDEFSIDSDAPKWMDKPVTGSDMPSMGLELLSDRDNPRLRDAVRRYAASDVEPLFELHQKLRG